MFEHCTNFSRDRIVLCYTFKHNLIFFFLWLALTSLHLSTRFDWIFEPGDVRFEARERKVVRLTHVIGLDYARYSARIRPLFWLILGPYFVESGSMFATPTAGGHDTFIFASEAAEKAHVPPRGGPKNEGEGLRRQR